MAFNFGTVTQWDDANSIMDPQVAVIAQAIQPAMNTGNFYQSMVAPDVAIDNEQYEIYSRSKTSKSGTMEAINDTVLTLTVSDAAAKGLTNGHILKIDDEVVVVDSVNQSTDVLTFYSRGAGGTSAAAHTSGSFETIGYAGKDCELKNVESSEENTLVYLNYVQTIFDTLDYTYMAKILARQGLPQNQIDLLLAKESAVRVAEYIAQASVRGYKQAGSKSLDPNMAAGLLVQLADTNSGARDVLTLDAASAAISETILNSACQSVFAKGKPDTIWMSTSNKTVVNAFNATSSDVDVTSDIGSSVAGTWVSHYNYDGALLQIKVDADMPDTDIAITTSASCKAGWLKDDVLRFVDEPASSSREIRKCLQGSLGFMINNVGYDHILIQSVG